MVKTVLNIIWLVLAGFWMALGYAIFGVIACILIITIPFGIASFRIARYALWPFGRTVIRRPDAGAATALGNFVWIIVAGIWLALANIVSGLLLCCTVIGIPLGIACFKLVPISMTPLGRVIVKTGSYRLAPTS